MWVCLYSDRRGVVLRGGDGVRGAFVSFLLSRDE